jgi:hypothetical protein
MGFYHVFSVIDIQIDHPTSFAGMRVNEVRGQRHTLVLVQGEGFCPLALHTESKAYIAAMSTSEKVITDDTIGEMVGRPTRSKYIGGIESCTAKPTPTITRLPNCSNGKGFE